MGQLGFLYDTSRCIGCKACQIACKEKNKLGVGDFFRRVTTCEIRQGGDTVYMNFSGACNHCQHPACTQVCPTGAMFIAADGTVQHRDDLCIGCGRCVHHCPYGAPSLNKVTGYAQKCDSCADYRAEGKLPACVAACPTRALRFGDLSELQSVYGGTADASPSFLPAPQQTNPSLLLCRNSGTQENPPEAAASENREPSGCFTAQASDFSKKRYVILGGGAAAVSAAKAIRARDDQADIRMISAEKRVPYCRPMLSKGLLNSFSFSRYSIISEQWMNDHQIRFTGGVQVTSLNPQVREITLNSGEVVSYSKCIYALGAECFIPPIPGKEKAGVFTLRHDSDLNAIRTKMLTAKNAIVIGGGITGLEIAWELKKAGLSVTVMDLADVLMGRLLDSKSSRVLRSCIEDAGVRIETGVRIRGIEGAEAAEQIALEDGRIFPAELVILSTGFRPNIAIAQQAGLRTEKAICVNSRMETSCPDIYACGDCADLSASTWMQSIQQGEIAGANATGEALEFSASAEPAMVHTADTSLLSVGDMGKQPDKDYELTYCHAKRSDSRYYVNPKTSHRQESFFALCSCNDVLTGITVIGDLSSMISVQDAVQQHWTVERFIKTASERGIILHAE